jgi:tetratricopeptide (TPR) repeat protein
MKKIISISILIWMCSTAYAQSVGVYQKRADSLFEIGEYEASKGYYASEALKQSKESAYYFYCQTKNAECAIRLNNLEEAQTIIEASFKFITSTFILEKVLLQNTQAKIFYQKGLINQAISEINSAIESVKQQGASNAEVLAE